MSATHKHFWIEGITTKYCETCGITRVADNVIVLGNIKHNADCKCEQCFTVEVDGS